MSEFNSAVESGELPKVLRGGLFIAVLATLVYWPSVKGTFIIDDNHVMDNPIICSPNGLCHLWSTETLARAEEFYYPVSYSSFWLQWRLWGTNPSGYRITNLVLHIVTAWLLWGILRKLLIPGAFLGALLFTVHPANVECVAWIFQHRDLLASALCLFSIACYLQADPRFLAGPDELDPAQWQGRRFSPFRMWGWYALSFLAYVLATLSKLSVVPLPVVLLLIIWWKDRIRFWDLARIGLFFLAGGALLGFNLWLRSLMSPTLHPPSLAERLDRAGAVVWFYLSKALLPIHLSLTYPQWHIDTSALLWWLPLLAAASITALLFWRRHGAWGRALIFAWAVFCAAVAPVSGLDDAGGYKHSIVWDHYEHLALIVPTVLVAAGWGYWRRRTRMRRGVGALAATLVCLLSLLTWQRSSLFGSPIDLFQDAVVKNPESWLANLYYGDALAKTGRLEEAIELLRHLVHAWPDFPRGHFRLGLVLLEAGRPQEAAECYRQMLRLEPDSPLAHNNLGNALYKSGHLPEAIAEYQQAIRLNPDLPEAEHNLALVLEQQGKFPEAIEHFQRAIRLNSNNPELFNRFGLVLSNAGRPQEALVQLQKALQLKAEFPEAYNNLGIALTRLDRTPEGIEQFEEAVRLKPEFADAHLNLGVALGKTGRLQDAIKQFDETLRLNPENIHAYTNMTQAYVLLKHPAEAIASAEKALELARAQGKTAEADEIAAWLTSYRSQQNNSSSAAPPSGAEPPANRQR